ncbi:hypothetical protein KQI65_01940 [bacterium]|nr:hypothetical protein [bacterium]
MKNSHSVDDLYLASWLLSNNVALQDHKRSYGYSIFYFEAGPDTDRLIEEFNTNEKLNKFARSLRQLKSIMYASGRTTPDINTTHHEQTKGNYTGA